MPILERLDFLKGNATLGFQILPAGGINGAPPNALVLSEWEALSREMVKIRDSAEVRQGLPRRTPTKAFFKRAPFWSALGMD